jgi:hypothetical protein
MGEKEEKSCLMNIWLGLPAGMEGEGKKKNFLI